jgi:hypothetical protein
MDVNVDADTADVGTDSGVDDLSMEQYVMMPSLFCSYMTVRQLGSVSTSLVVDCSVAYSSGTFNRHLAAFQQKVDNSMDIPEHSPVFIVTKITSINDS